MDFIVYAQKSPLTRRVTHGCGSSITRVADKSHFIDANKENWQVHLDSRKKLKTIRNASNSFSAFSPSPLTNLAVSWHGQGLKPILPFRFWEGETRQGHRKEEMPSTMPLPPCFDPARVLCALHSREMRRAGVRSAAARSIAGLPGEGSRGPHVAMVGEGRSPMMVHS